MAKKQAATPEGAATEKKEPAPTNPKDQFRDELIARQRAERDAEVIPLAVEDEPEPKPIEGELVDNDPPEEFDDLIIDGVGQKVAKTKIYETGKRSLQKELAADKRLADAKTESERILADAKAEAAKMVQKVDTKPVDTLSLDEETLDSIAHDLQYGDDTERREAVKKLLTAASGAKATQAGAETLTEEKVKVLLEQEKQKQLFESALDNAKKPPSEGGYSDLFADPLLLQLLTFEDSRLAKEEPELSYSARLKKAGDTIRSKINPTISSPDNDSRNTQRKAELTDASTSVSAAPLKGGNNRPETGSERHARHLAEAQAVRRGQR